MKILIWILVYIWNPQSTSWYLWGKEEWRRLISININVLNIKKSNWSHNQQTPIRTTLTFMIRDTKTVSESTTTVPPPVCLRIIGTESLSVWMVSTRNKRDNQNPFSDNGAGKNAQFFTKYTLWSFLYQQALESWLHIQSQQ